MKQPTLTSDKHELISADYVPGQGARLQRPGHEEIYFDMEPSTLRTIKGNQRPCHKESIHVQLTIKKNNKTYIIRRAQSSQPLAEQNNKATEDQS